MGGVDMGGSGRMGDWGFEGREGDGRCVLKTGRLALTSVQSNQITSSLSKALSCRVPQKNLIQV